MKKDEKRYVLTFFSVVSTSFADLGSGAFFGPLIQDPGWVKNQDPDPG
jgi:hypothetical protein